MAKVFGVKFMYGSRASGFWRPKAPIGSIFVGITLHTKEILESVHLYYMQVHTSDRCAHSVWEGLE